MQALKLAIGTAGWTASIERRDATMAENVLHLIRARPDRRQSAYRPACLDGPIHLQSIEPGAASSVCYDPIAAALDMLCFVSSLRNAQQLVETELAADIAAIDATRA